MEQKPPHEPNTKISNFKLKIHSKTNLIFDGGFSKSPVPQIINKSSGFEDLAARQQNPAHEPDEGPAAPHITAGAVAVGVRPLMVAWNIELTGAPEAELLCAARSAAASMRGSASGGVPNLQALGFVLPSVHSAQLSMNLHDVIGAAKTGITLHSIRDRAEREARALGASARGCLEGGLSGGKKAP